MKLHSFFILFMYVLLVVGACPYSVHTPCMYTEAIYTVDKERVPKLPTDQDSTNYYTTRESALLNREKSNSCHSGRYHPSRQPPAMYIFQQFGDATFRDGQKANVPACSRPILFCSCLGMQNVGRTKHATEHRLVSLAV